MKKNWKCILGATLLTPICVLLYIGIVFGITYIYHYIAFSEWFIVIPAILFVVGYLWYILFTFCKEHRSKKYNQALNQTGTSIELKHKQNAAG